MFQVPNVLEERGVTGDSGSAMAMETTDGLRCSLAGSGTSMKLVSVVVIFLDSEVESGAGPA